MIESLTTDITGPLRSALKSQYHAALAMLRMAIERTPDDLWTGRAVGGAGDRPLEPSPAGREQGEGSSQTYINPSWRIAYHTLYYTHLYSRPTVRDFTPWEHHQTGIHDLDDVPAPPEIQDLTEHPHRPPQTGEPYTKQQLLAYWSWCDDMIDEAVDALDLLSPESGFPWCEITKLEHQFVNIRHIQHHTAQLGSRIREASAGQGGVDWIGAGRVAKWNQFPDLTP